MLVRRGQSGAALVMVLMIVAVMSVVVSMSINRNHLLVSEARMLKEYQHNVAGVASLRSELVYLLTTTTLWSTGASAEIKRKLNLPLSFNFFGDPFEYLGAIITIQSQNGLLSLEPFNDEGMQDYLLSKGYDRAQVFTLIDSIKDWRDTDDFMRLNGAEKLAYSDPTFPRNDSIQMKEELRHVKGMTEDIWNDLRDYITLSGSTTLNLHYIPTEIIGFNKGETEKESLANSREQGKTPNWYTGGGSTHPGDRLRVTISLPNELTVYSESFTIVKTRGMKRPFVVTDVIVGKQ